MPKRNSLIIKQLAFWHVACYTLHVAGCLLLVTATRKGCPIRNH